jgi:BASS family bile acid:Na+ symporter
MGLNTQQTKTMCLEVGIQNTSLAFFIAYNLLGNMELAIPTACYGIIMFITSMSIPIYQRFNKPSEAEYV